MVGTFNFLNMKILNFSITKKNFIKLQSKTFGLFLRNALNWFH